MMALSNSVGEEALGAILYTLTDKTNINEFVAIWAVEDDLQKKSEYFRQASVTCYVASHIVDLRTTEGQLATWFAKNKKTLSEINLWGYREADVIDNTAMNAFISLMSAAFSFMIQVPSTPPRLDSIEDLIEKDVIVPEPGPALIHFLRRVRLDNSSDPFALMRIDIIMDRLLRSIETAESKERTGYIPPELEDIILTDGSEKIVSEEIAFALEVTYLSASQVVTWPAVGIVWGLNKRWFVNMSVQRKTRSAVNVIFLVDSATPYTFLSPLAIDAVLGVDGYAPSSFQALINGKSTQVERSPKQGHFADINVLGMNFLSSFMMLCRGPSASFNIANSIDQITEYIVGLQ
jgi:hypothetical protein